jgi:hypothetical protein
MAISFRALFVGALIVVSAVVPASAQTIERPTTGKELQLMCKGIELEKSIGPFPRTASDLIIFQSASACIGYIAALANLMLLPTASDSLHLCLPNGISMDQLKAEITEMVLNLPKELEDYNAAAGVIALLRMDAVASQRNCRVLPPK